MTASDAVTLLGPLLGGVGLFLLGMTMMTDGLKVAAGPALEQVLARSTSTRWRGLVSGIAITAAVQSSSAVTVAAIGFVNAGLLSLSQALWLLFGSNVGTTFTGWLVAMVGLRIKVELFALPLIGLGALARLVGRRARMGAFGQTVAGFGLLFLGIGLLQQSFAGLGDGVVLPAREGFLDTLALVGIGAALTVVMQASAASMTLALTAAQSGVIDVPSAAALIIGANIGTTATALLATLGATPNAKRAAAAHVLFNVLTAAVALALLTWLVSAIDWVSGALELGREPATELALFHSVFNVLGVLLMWPLADRLTTFLLARFRTAEEDETRPRHLDDNVLQVPVLALDAMRREVQRIGAIATRLVQRAAAGEPQSALVHEREQVVALAVAVERFVERAIRSVMSTESGKRLPRILRVLRYHESAAEAAFDAAPEVPSAAALPDDVAAADALWRDEAATLLHAAGPPVQPDVSLVVDSLLASAEARYQTLKATLLAAGAEGRLPLATMEARLRQASGLRRALQQTVKAALLGAEIDVDLPGAR